MRPPETTQQLHLLLEGEIDLTLLHVVQSVRGRSLKPLTLDGAHPSEEHTKKLTVFSSDWSVVD